MYRHMQSSSVIILQQKNPLRWAKGIDVLGQTEISPYNALLLPLSYLGTQFQPRKNHELFYP